MIVVDLVVDLVVGKIVVDLIVGMIVELQLVVEMIVVGVIVQLQLVFGEIVVEQRFVCNLHKLVLHYHKSFADFEQYLHHHIQLDMVSIFRLLFYLTRHKLQSIVPIWCLLGILINMVHPNHI